MHIDDETREAFAPSVPVYVRAQSDGTWSVISTEMNEPMSVEHATERKALDHALKIKSVASALKDAVLRDEGEPIGAWRWLDASEEEDEPVGNTRITARSLWEMAASLNDREAAIPINGGGAPRAGYAESLPHGDAYLGGDHVANGWAHVAIPVVDADERTHLYLRGELFEEIAREVDLGRLAFGSIRFGMTSVDEEDNYAVEGASLVSHALTNDPAVTTLSPGSKRRNEPALIGCRSRRLFMTATKKKAQRAASPEKFAEVLAALGVDAEGDDWAEQALAKIAEMKKPAAEEKTAEEKSAEEPAAVSDVAASAEARSRSIADHCRDVRDATLHAGARRTAALLLKLYHANRAELGVAPEDAQAAAESMLVWGRDVLGKPDATMAEVLAELEARKEEVGAALDVDTPPPAEDESEPLEEQKTAADLEAQKSADHETKLRERDTKIARLEKREEVRKLVVARGLDRPAGHRPAITDAEIEEFVDDAMLRSGSLVMVTKLLDAKNAPPSTNPLDGQPVMMPPATYAEAMREDGPVWAEAEKIERAKNPKVAKQVIAGRAARIIEKNFPALLSQS